MWARLNKRGTHVVAKDERRKKNRLSSSNDDGIDYDVASVVVRTDVRRRCRRRRCRPSRQPGSAGFDCGLKCWSVGLQNE